MGAPKADGKDGTYRLLVWAAIATLLLVVGATTYTYVTGVDEGGVMEYRRGNLRLEDGEFQQALADFDTSLGQKPTHAPSHLGRALALMALGRNEEAIEAFGTALALEPEFAAAYANRGILYDRLGRHREALEDYRQALRLDPELGEGPDWLTRFFRLQVERPPTIADRAVFLEEELKKPPEQRRLVNPELDSQQRSYKFEGVIDSNR